MPGPAPNDLIVEHGPRFVCLTDDRLLKFDHPAGAVAAAGGAEANPISAVIAGVRSVTACDFGAGF
ncbi:MAG: hypothetical protein L0J17_06050 [Brevibacterium sp.]|uniref:hypothetical protein n=1 Tax=Brevibacterium sp. TaxID=1701 RepID=UPI002647E117|nr:hypothetical protein [Brevibacterium sp.]MDN5807332.1 hypothetical protein [Brevibacterium sp.]MDN5833833.1 hypothetical protein [Brevibacterium sp.]MDN5910647.1 hypothetical protein [Brevibacterium sp.]MDN6133324.1 hypothetical protein [Brevibacterium sp.]MDN6157033.1 hypothetical protein [Brevibacterium sp.]